VTATDYRVNRQIRIPEVRLIDQNGEQVGIVQTMDALKRAEDAGLDLVEVSPTARPPVCRILDFGKFKYAQRKKERGTHARASQLKELRVRPAIDKHDLEYRLEQGRKFLLEGHKVQVVCIFRGRQMAHPEHGYNVMKQVAETLADVSKVESHPKLMGKRMTMLLSHK
jgi:translation initiation factor IF-3